VADCRRHNDAQAHLRDARRGDVKGVAGIERSRDAHDNGGVTGKDEAIGGKIPRVLETKGAEADSQRERAEERHPLLGEERDEEKRYPATDQCPDNAVEALCQDQPALRLRDNEDDEQCPLRLIEVEGAGDEQGDQRRRHRLRDEEQPGPTRFCSLDLLRRGPPLSRVAEPLRAGS
jgi:hypothetical protein